MKTERVDVLNQNAASDAAYRVTSRRLGSVFLLFVVLFVGLNALADACLAPWLYNLNDETDLLVGELVSGVIYLVSFLIPAWLLWRMTPRDERKPLLLAPHLPRCPHLTLPAGLAVIYAASCANDFLMRSFGWASGEASVPYWVDGMPLFEGVLLFLTAVLIPTFCEELLFRGVVLSVLRPYGGTVAVLGSAVLFALMHQSADQLLYTAVGGVVLAYITLESRSIWGAMLLHLLNNALAALKVVLYETLASGTAKLWFAMAEVVVIGAGLCALALLLLRKRDTAQGLEDGDTHPPMRPVKGFLTWPMALFVGVSVAQMVLLVMLEALKVTK